jgi:hypothetical protein
MLVVQPPRTELWIYFHSRNAWQGLFGGPKYLGTIHITQARGAPLTIGDVLFVLQCELFRKAGDMPSMNARSIDSSRISMYVPLLHESKPCDGLRYALPPRRTMCSSIGIGTADNGSTDDRGGGRDGAEAEMEAKGVRIHYCHSK